MKPRVRVLFVGQDSADASLLDLVLGAEIPGTEVVHVADPVTLGREIERADFDFVVCDEALDWCGAARVLVEVRSRRPDVTVVVLTLAETPTRAAPNGQIEITLKKSSAAFLRVPSLLRSALEAPAAVAGSSAVDSRVQGLLDRSRIGVFRLTLDGRLLLADETFLRILGADSIEQARQLELSALAPQLQGGFTETGKVRKRELRLQGVGERRIWAALTEVVGHNETGQPVLDGLLEDIGERRPVLDEPEVETSRLIRSNEDLRMFASLAAHELKEPLRTIEQSTRVLLEDAGPLLRGEVRESAKLVVEGVRRLQSMIEGLLTLARFGASEEWIEPCSCPEIIGEVLASLKAKIDETDARVNVEALPTVRADPTQLRLVFRNLISNAIQFHGESPPRIRIAAHQDGDDWVFSVTDKGIGVAHQEAERIFERFARIGNGSGAGLGLAICKNVVERHGGRIWVESEPNQGATFYFTIPLSVARSSDGVRVSREELV